MHAALLQLGRLRLKAAIRRMLRTMKTPQGVVFTLLGGLLFVVWLGPVVLSNLVRREHTLDADTVLLYGPAVLFVLCVINIISRFGRGALYFTPAEIDFLFPAPLRRLDLLHYKMIGLLFASIGVAVLFTVFLSSLSSSLICTFVGTFLALLFINLFSVAAALIKENIAHDGAKKLRLLVGTVVLALTTAIAVPLMNLTAGLELQEAIREVLAAPSVRMVLAPMTIFVKVITAVHLTVFALWAAMAIALNLFVYGVIAHLDALNLESALQSSEKQHAQLEKAKRSGAANVWKGAARWRIPVMPRLGGAGAILWRQSTTALRTSKSLLLMLAVLIAIIWSLAMFVETEAPAALGALIGPGVFSVFFLVTMTRFDFRNDLDQLEWLKMLPIRTRTLVVGQMLAPLTVLTAVQWLALGAVGTVFGYVHLMLIVAAFTLPLNILLVGMENALFLLYPTRHLSAGFGDLHAMGRNMVLFIVRFAVLVAWMAFAAASAWGVMFVAGGWSSFLVAAWLVLSATSLAVIPVTALAFRKFDVSVHMPA